MVNALELVVSKSRKIKSLAKISMVIAFGLRDRRDAKADQVEMWS